MIEQLRYRARLRNISSEEELSNSFPALWPKTKSTDPDCVDEKTSENHHTTLSGSTSSEAREYSTSEIPPTTSTVGNDSSEAKLDEKSHERKKDRKPDNESDRSPEVELINSGKTSSKKGVEQPTTARSSTKGSLDKDWEYFHETTSKGRLKKRPKLRPIEQKLFKRQVKNCQVNCLRKWTKKKERKDFVNSIEMRVEMNRDWKVIDCLKRAENRSSEKDCFIIDGILRSQLRTHLRKNNSDNSFDPRNKSGKKIDTGKRMRRGAIADSYFKKHKLLENFTPASITSTTTDLRSVISVRRSIYAEKPSIWTHESVRARGNVELMYYGTCKLVCEEYWYQMYDGKSNEASGENTSEEGVETTTMMMMTTEKRKSIEDDKASEENLGGIDSGLIDSSEKSNTVSKATSESSSRSEEVKSKEEIGRSVSKSRENSQENFSRWSTKESENDKQKVNDDKKTTTLLVTTTQISTTEESNENLCPNGWFHCDRGRCIKYHLVCNKKYNCKDRSDEGECNYLTEELEDTDYGLEYDGSGSTSDDDDDLTSTTLAYDLHPTTKTNGRSESTTVETATTSSGHLEITTTETIQEWLSALFGKGDELMKSQERNRLKIDSSHEKLRHSNSKTNDLRNMKSEEVNQEQCPDGQYYCDKGKCIKYRLVCNGKFDCKDHSDENNCNYSGEELEYPDYDSYYDSGSGTRDDKELSTTQSYDSHTTSNESVNSMDVSKSDFVQVDDSHENLVLSNSEEEEKSKQEIKKDRKKDKQQNSESTSQVQKTIQTPTSREVDKVSTNHGLEYDGSGSKSDDEDPATTTTGYSKSPSSGEIASEEDSSSGENKNDEKEFELIDNRLNIKTTMSSVDESTSEVSYYATSSTALPASRRMDSEEKELERRTSTTERVRLKENYNAYNISFVRNDPRSKEYLRYDARRREYQRRIELQRSERLRQQEIRRHQYAEEEQRAREEQEDDRRREEIYRRQWELRRQNMAIEEQLRQIRIERLNEMNARYRTDDHREVNSWRRWSDEKDCNPGNHRYNKTGRLIKGRLR